MAQNADAVLAQTALAILQDMTPEGRVALEGAIRALTAYQSSDVLAAAGGELHYLLDTHPGGPIRPRPLVYLFACIMEYKLRRHDGKPGWRGNTRERWQRLLERITDERHELRDALCALQDRPADSNLALEAWFEAADVGNMALICADVAAPLPVLQPVDTRGRELPVGSTGPDRTAEAIVAS